MLKCTYTDSLLLTVLPIFLAPSGELTADELLPAVTIRPAHRGPHAGVLPFPAPLRAIARAAAAAMMDRCDGNRGEAARRLAISSRRLRRLLEETLDEETDETSASPAGEETG